MKVVLSSPMGCSNQETGIVHLLANYVRDVATSVTQVRCNGLFSLCDRDADNGWRRSIDTCVGCMQEQGRLASWSGAELVELGQFLPATDVEETRRWMLSIPSGELAHLTFEGRAFFDLCGHLFRARFGNDAPVPTNKQHDQFLRRLFLSQVRIQRAVRRFLFAHQPDLLFVNGERDTISKVLGLEADRLGIKAVRFHWQRQERIIRITLPERTRAEGSTPTNQKLDAAKTVACDIVITNVLALRNDARTWPLEMITALEDILGALGLSRGQLLAPAAR